MTGLHRVVRPHLAEMIDYLPAEHLCQGMIDLHLLDGGDIPTPHLDHHPGAGKRVVRPQEGVRLEQIDSESAGLRYDGSDKSENDSEACEMEVVVAVDSGWNT